MKTLGTVSIAGAVERQARLTLAELRRMMDAEIEDAARTGFPRLVGPAGCNCFLGVKSVDRIEVSREPRPATAETIARSRLSR